MADNQLDILIKFGLSKEKATEAVSELKKLKDVTTEVGKEGVKQEAAVEEATKKTFTSKKQLKDMLKQLGHEFPLLGQIGRMALNPIVFTTAGITAAFQIWKTRTDELTKSLGGVAMPDISDDHLARLDKFAEKFGNIVNNAESAKTKLKELQDQIDANAAFAQALGIDVGTGPAKEKADLATRFGQGLVASGLDKMQAGSAISAEDLAKLKTLADSAQKDTVERRGRIGDIDFTQGLASYDPRRLFYDNRFRARYGYGTTYDQARAIEEGAIGSNQNLVNYYGTMTQRAALFSAGKAEREQGLGVLKENVGARRAIGNQDAAAFMQAFGAVDTSNLASLGPKMVSMVQALMAMLDSVEKANEELRRKQAIQNRKP